LTLSFALQAFSFLLLAPLRFTQVSVWSDAQGWKITFFFDKRVMQRDKEKD